MPEDYQEFADFIRHLTDNARASLQHADAIARSFGSAYIGTEHLLLGVLAQDGSIGSKILQTNGVSIDRARMALNMTPKTLVINLGSKGLSETAKLTLKMSWDIAQEYSQDYCGTEHILYGLLSQKNARGTQLLYEMNVNVDSIMNELEQYLNRQQDDDESSTRTKRKGKKRGSALDYFGTDLTEKARMGELDPVVGREPQIKRMVTILGRRTKNNPVLIGEPGVGKTAIVEGLAQRIVQEDVPDVLLEKRVVMLDLAGMVAGTKYRGEFEERLKKVMDEIVSDPNIIVFIDELHLIVGAGAAEGSIDAGNILKPALARGKMRVIGATTMDEYRKYVEKDVALERRFQPVVVPETTVQETIAILKGLKKQYESHHGVKISDEVIEDAVLMAKRYVNDRYMPDKAIDLIDEAASHVRIERHKVKPEQRKLQKELRSVTARMEEAVDAEDYEKAAKYKTRMSQINKQLEALKTSESETTDLALTSDDIAHVVATMTGVPVSKVVKTEAKALLGLEKLLGAHVMGQDEAVAAVARAIRRNRSGISDARRPIGSFIFLGPTGVGKTELARVLAREYFGSEKSLVKIDMSEFGERHTVSRLVGAPAGYVGYEDAGQLTEKVRRQPYSLVLFDEIEKAHPEVFNILLQMLEDGYLTDAKGRRVDFTNTVIIMTSNIGAQKLQKEATLGFSATTKDDAKDLESMHNTNTDKVMDEVKKLMRPELINRIDKIIVFRALTKKNAESILELQLKELSDRLRKTGLALHVTPSVKRYLIDHGYDAQNGVRPLRRIIQDKLEDEIADGLLSGTYKKGDTIAVDAKSDKLSFKLVSE